jgi:putative membrane protein
MDHNAGCDARPATFVSVAEQEREPDYRFSLANERTFLAWVRTALALLAAAVAIVKLVPGGELSWLRRVLGVLLGAIGLAVSASAYARYRSVQAAMRRGQPLPRAAGLPVLGLAIVVAAGLVVVLVIAG